MQFKGNMVPTKEVPIGTMQRIIKLIHEGNQQWSVTENVACSDSIVSKIWYKYKRNGIVPKGKENGRPQKTSKCQNRKHKTMCIENRNIMQENKRKRNGLKEE